MVPLIVLLIIERQMMGAFYLFVIAGLTDGLDGFLAKRFNWSSELGAWLDPAADKALLVSIYVTLGLFGHIPVWLVILVVSRDLLIVGGILLSMMMENPVGMKPLLVSKINTVGQILLAAAILADLGFALGLGKIVTLFILLVAVSTIVSTLAYLYAWFKHMVPHQ
ncbi:MAG: CDP-alcohol phosphatidyltransferase family protein [Hyphomicrobiaceae bacterium]|nr:CDP-alcohol phosphatidyltransferase family protein [Hyphomicrobiaceae bacterium]